MFSEIPQEQAEKLSSFGIHLGAPLLFAETGHIKVPPSPHVFFCKYLYLILPPSERDKELQALGNVILPNVELTNEKGEKETALLFEDVMTMLGHGIVMGDQEKQWVFLGTRKPVSETVGVYEGVARQTDWPQVDVVVACREEANNNPSQQVRVTFSRRQIPYIYPDDTAHVLNTPEVTSMLKNGEGASLVVKAERWNGLKWWLIYWSYNSRDGSIPLWALMPSHEAK